MVWEDEGQMTDKTKMEIRRRVRAGMKRDQRVVVFVSVVLTIVTLDTSRTILTFGHTILLIPIWAMLILIYILSAKVCLMSREWLSTHPPISERNEVIE